MEEVGVSVSEEEMIDSLFYRCDSHGEGSVHVYNVIQFLKNCLGNGNNEPDLLELSTILESSCIDGKINLASYRQAVKQWVTEIRNRCESTSFLEPDGPLNSPYNLCNSSTDRSLCIETSGIGDGSFHKTEDDIGELLQELEDLKFQNRKLSEEQVQFRIQLNTQEEVATNLTTELQNRNQTEELLRKKIKSLQDLLEFRQSVMDENEELKAKLFSTQELKRDIDTKVVNLERENVNLQNQVKNYECKWQKACAEVDEARKELQHLQNTHTEQKDLLISVQEAKSTQEEALTKKDEEVASLNERLNQLMEQNEKLQEEKEDVHVRLSQMDGKLHRYQTKVEQLGLSEDSLIGNENAMEKSKMFSTPLPKNSICMELKDRLNEDANLPSPFCEKMELSTGVSYINRRSALLPTYMSAWDFEVSNKSLQDYSLELLKHRKSLSPELCDSDLEKKLESLKDLEKDGLQKEIIKLYRANLELAEKCHKSELKEAELREEVNDTNHRSELDRQKFLQLEESLESSIESREIDLKDLWRLVHNPDEEDTSESECSLSASTEQLKEQIRKEIGALKNKLGNKKKALNSLGVEKSRVFRELKKRTSNSPLVEALNLDSVKITKKHHKESENCACQHEKHVLKCNRSVPVIRKHNSDVSGDSHRENSECEISNCEKLKPEISHIGTDTFDNKEDPENMHRRDIPMRFKSGSLSGSENEVSLTSNGELSKELSRNSLEYHKLEKSGLPRAVKTDVSGKGFEELMDQEENSDTGIEFRKQVTKQFPVHKDKGHAMLRRRSYKRAIENPPSTGDKEPKVNESRNSFQNAIASPTNLYGTASFSVSDTTPENQSADASMLIVAPKFSSTPLPVSYTRPDQTDLKSFRNEKSVKWKDFENVTEICYPEEIAVIMHEKSNPVQTELFKADNMDSNRFSPCNSAALSILLEEETNANPDSLRTHSINSGLGSTASSQLSDPIHSKGSDLEKTSVSGRDFSAEIWTLSGNSESNSGSKTSRDSGHSSSITSFEKANISAINEMPSSPKSSVSHTSGSSPAVSTSASVSLSVSPIISTDNISYADSKTNIDVKQSTSEIKTTPNDSCNVCLSNEHILKDSGDYNHSKPVETFKSDFTDVVFNFDTAAGAVSCSNSGNADNGQKSVTSEINVPECVPDKNQNMTSPLNQKIHSECVSNPNSKGHYSSLSYQNERNLAPSERILQRSAANKSTEKSEIKQTDANHVHLPHRIVSEPKAVKSAVSSAPSMVKPSSNNKKGLTVDIGGSGTDKVDNDLSDNSEPPSPAICFFKVGENGLKTSQTDQNKNTVVNGVGANNNQALVPGEGADHAGGDGPRFPFTSNLSKIRENHLAKRRDYIRQNKMPQLSELSEKEAAENNNEEKQAAPPGINIKEAAHHLETNGDVIMPSIPDEFLQKHDLTSTGKSSEELSDQEIESKFTSLSLAFKTDAQTLEKRLEIQERSRDIAEQNVDKELQGLRSCLETLNQICTDPQVREVLSKIQNHVDILEKSTARVSSRAEVFGAIQQEKRMSKAVDIMVHHVENIRRVHEREHAELEEARKLLQDSRSLAPSTLDLAGGDMRRSASVCQNNMFGFKLSPQGGPTSNPLSPSTAKAIKLLKATRRRVSEIALPKVLGGTGAATLHPSASMDSFYTEPRPLRPLHSNHLGMFKTGTESSMDEDEGNMHTAHIDSDSNSLRANFEADARSRFQAVIASTTVKSAVANTLRRASLEKQNHVQSVSPAATPQVSRDNSSDSANKTSETQDKEKQKNLEEEAFKKGYEQGMRASLGQDLSSLREQQNNINENLGEIMDTIDNQMEEPKSLKEMLVTHFNETVPKIKISSWRIRMTFGCFFIALAILSVIVSLLPVGSASLLGYRHYGRPPV